MGIKSFQGAREVIKKEFNAPILVENYMTSDLIIFSPHQSIQEVMEAFIKHRISGGPVVDERGKLVGIISEADCMKHISESRYFNMPILENSVEKHMTTDVETIPPDMNIFDAASHFHKSKRRRLPVLEKGKLVGQVSRKDIVIAALKLSSQNWL
ncbi:CBS domain-containing protein [Abyssalbus ytuae]|uniref:CBS domain-containing protein n=1 Tax=Abyssalbus ytuae TaxID=2926907 RepID=A0A9E6ZVP4_9FLAO|nr:CBS domain-containing protein [Abyssalbus ytuae]UOB16087.1 CBS domain-containing protein [Abyssalbus ytuae]